MLELPRSSERDSVVSSAVVVGCVATLAVAVGSGVDPRYVLPVALIGTIGAAFHRLLSSWTALLAALLLVILFMPIRRYSVPGNLPFQLEPYRLLVFTLALGWIVTLLVDPRVRLRKSGYEGPLGLVLISAVGSVLVNVGRIHDLGVTTDVAKKLTFLVSFFIVYYLIVSVVRSRARLDSLLQVLVAGGAILACFALVEAATHVNVFNKLHTVMPFLHLQQLPFSLGDSRGGRLRVYASAEHPIALGAFLVMLLPLALYVCKATQRAAWWVAALLLLLGGLCTVSRTAVLMLLAIVIVFLVLRPRELRRMWWVLPPALVIVHLALPGTLGAFNSAFFPKGGLVAEQRKGEGSRGTGRVNEIGPSIREWAQRPILGEGYGSRITDKARQNAPILDDQWLGVLLETGIAGILGWCWVYVRFFRRMKRLARSDPSPTGLLAVGLAASVTAFAVGMLTYDAMSFIQVTFLLWILLAFGSVLETVVERPAPGVALEPAPVSLEGTGA